MSENNEQETYQTPEAEDFDQTLKPEEKETLSAEEVAQRKADFYKNLYKKARSEKKLPTQEQPKVDIEARLSEQEARVELRMAGYSVEEIREIDRYAKGAGISLTEAEKTPFVQSAVKSMKAEKSKQDAVLEPSPRSVTVGGKNANDVLVDPNASASDKQSAYEAKMKAIRR